jgi:hypothetical protein
MCMHVHIYLQPQGMMMHARRWRLNSAHKPTLSDTERQSVLAFLVRAPRPGCHAMISNAHVSDREDTTTICCISGSIGALFIDCVAPLQLVTKGARAASHHHLKQRPPLASTHWAPRSNNTRHEACRCSPLVFHTPAHATATTHALALSTLIRTQRHGCAALCERACRYYKVTHHS